MKHAHREWQNRVRAEYGSAALTAQAVHWMIQLGLPLDLIHRGLRVVRDELDHAELSQECLEAIGGPDQPAEVELASLSMPEAPEGVFASLVDTVLRNFCLGETFAVPLFDAMRRHTRHPKALAVLERVLRDEAAHRAFGWDVLDCLLEIDEAGVRARAQASVPGLLQSYEQSYARSTLKPGAEELALGLLEGETYKQIFENTLSGEIRPRFAKRGITV